MRSIIEVVSDGTGRSREELETWAFGAAVVTAAIAFLRALDALREAGWGAARK